MSRRRWLVRAVLGAVLAAAGPVAFVASTGTAQAAAALPLDQLTASLTQVAFGLQRPTAIVGVADGRLLITEKPGAVRAFHPDTGLDATPLLNIADRVDISGNERGLLGIAPAPDFATSNTVYVAYTALPDGALTLSRFTLGDPASEQVILTQEHAQFRNHNGGQVTFGPDGYLYWSLGDGGNANDPFKSGQRLDTLLGKIVRLDVSSPCGAQAYCVPADNPFVGVAGARPEIWNYGLRNAWKFSFDPADRSLWIADVGQGTWEEVNHLPTGGAGANLGWSCREGAVVFDAAQCAPGATYVDPAFSYRTSLEGCAVIGGHVYRGERYADLADGTYVVTDYCSATIWGVRPAAGGGYESAVLTQPDIVQPTSLGVAADGDIYLVNDLPGQVYRMSFAAKVACRVSYETQAWGTGFRANVTLTNTGTQPVTGWTVGWTYAGPQKVGSAWNAAVTQDGAAVAARNASWNGTVAAGASVTFGFLGTPGGAQPNPTTFTLNGAPCT
ncbi:PQQ-dependent sugar dehydrogenase [Actinomycetes bacterium KLBMP 9797]